MGDADDSYDFANLDPFVDALRGGFKLVVGNRFRGGIRPGAMPLLNRYVGNPALTFIGRWLFASPVGDFHCGLRGFERRAILALGLRAEGMEFASEMVVKASLAGLRIGEVPTTLSPDGRGRRPHLRPWRDGWRHLRFMLLRSPQWLFLYPGLALTLLGLAGGAVLAVRPVSLFGLITLDIDALLYCAVAAIVGLQISFFGLFAMALARKMNLPLARRYGVTLLKLAPLERSILVGVCLIAAGAAGAIYAVVRWGHTLFRGTRTRRDHAHHDSFRDRDRPGHADRVRCLPARIHRDRVAVRPREAVRRQSDPRIRASTLGATRSSNRVSRRNRRIAAGLSRSTLPSAPHKPRGSPAAAAAKARLTAIDARAARSRSCERDFNRGRYLSRTVRICCSSSAPLLLPVMVSEPP